MIDHSLLSNIQGATNALERVLAGEELSFQDGLQLIREENLFSLVPQLIWFATRLAETRLRLPLRIT